MIKKVTEISKPKRFNKKNLKSVGMTLAKLKVQDGMHSSSKTDLQAVNYVVNASVQSSIQVLYMGHSRL